MPASIFTLPSLVEIVDIIVRCTIVYIAILAVLRLAGKRYQGTLSPHDFVVMLLIANAVQAAMVGASLSLVGGLVGAVTLVAINVLVARLLLHHRKIGPLLAATPTLLIRNGVVLEANLRRENILTEELEAQLRGHGYESAADVKIAIQESDGSISVIGFRGAPQEQQMPPLPSKRPAAPVELQKA